MKRIAILRCLRSNDVCTGAGCMQALNKRKGSFAVYENEDIELEAYWSCNGCADCFLRNQQGIEEKLKRIISLHLDAVHIGVCTRQRTTDGNWERCKVIDNICEKLLAEGIKIVEGTH